jgi:hypothetical protein
MFKKFQALGKVIDSVKPKVNKTKLDKAKSNLNIAIQKTKGSKAKLNQTLFEIKNKMPLTFKKSTKKSESNTEAYKRIQKDNTKVLKGMLDKAVENKKDGGRMGLKKGSKFPDHSGDGKITQKDILMAKGVIPKTKSKKKII